ncbi:hypothetical protein EDEG_02384 [Edhazardia aedis USNM 41457]|uniref:Uncharacterized protein n=1 Tax=Edhazardia aedis (strain USNM 41457) TaxID=1003232 RepID=J9D606_EDHAE|nr:hypothetical protein EDEG_02384 [Edhazardia aedis USNM 41457]|eukprot:EJW03216.1 hypothetical protein EDEG_02384 [Edhazardia aedis USNM 41457]
MCLYITKNNFNVNKICLKSDKCYERKIFYIVNNTIYKNLVMRIYRCFFNFSLCVLFSIVKMIPTRSFYFPFVPCIFNEFDDQKSYFYDILQKKNSRKFLILF